MTEFLANSVLEMMMMMGMCMLGMCMFCYTTFSKALSNFQSSICM